MSTTPRWAEEIRLRCDAQDALERLGCARLLTWDQVRRALALVWAEEDLNELRRDVLVALAEARASGVFPASTDEDVGRPPVVRPGLPPGLLPRPGRLTRLG